MGPASVLQPYGIEDPWPTVCDDAEVPINPGDQFFLPDSARSTARALRVNLLRYVPTRPLARRPTRSHSRRVYRRGDGRPRQGPLDNRFELRPSRHDVDGSKSASCGRRPTRTRAIPAVDVRQQWAATPLPPPSEHLGTRWPPPTKGDLLLRRLPSTRREDALIITTDVRVTPRRCPSRRRSIARDA